MDASDGLQRRNRSACLQKLLLISSLWSCLQSRQAFAVPTLQTLSGHRSIWIRKWHGCTLMKQKAGNAIGVPLNETACQILRKQQGLHKRWVFVHTKPAYRSDGTKTAAVRKMRTDSNKAWKGALKRAGISNFRFHDLRHTRASWLVQSGVSLLALKEMGGWETLEMVQRYAHLSAGHLTEHASKIDAIISRNGTNTAQEENVVYLNVR